MAHPRKRRQVVGISHLAIGLALLAVAAIDPGTFLGAGLAFVGMGMVLLARPHQDNRP